MKEHRLSPMREEQSSLTPVNDEGSQNMVTGAAGVCQPGSVISAGSNKKPRSRTKVHYVTLLTLFRTHQVIIMALWDWF